MKARIEIAMMVFTLIGLPILPAVLAIATHGGF